VGAGAPHLRCGRRSREAHRMFGASHPFARKKTKGRGAQNPAGESSQCAPTVTFSSPLK
jgi:hypothetical protein